MSWDILLVRLPETVASVFELPRDYEVQPIGTRADVHRALRAALPDADLDLRDPTWGFAARPGPGRTLSWMIEIAIGEADPVESVMLYVRGGEDVIPVIFQIADGLGCRPHECSGGDLLARYEASNLRTSPRFA